MFIVCHMSFVNYIKKKKHHTKIKTNMVYGVWWPHIKIKRGDGNHP
jgi:hypothetical protein